MRSIYSWFTKSLQFYPWPPPHIRPPPIMWLLLLTTFTNQPQPPLLILTPVAVIFLLYELLLAPNYLTSTILYVYDHTTKMASKKIRNFYHHHYCFTFFLWCDNVILDFHSFSLKNYLYVSITGFLVENRPW